MTSLAENNDMEMFAAQYGEFGGEIEVQKVCRPESARPRDSLTNGWLLYQVTQMHEDVPWQISLTAKVFVGVNAFG